MITLCIALSCWAVVRRANELILLGVGNAGIGGPTTLVYDTATDSDGTAITAHTISPTPNGNSWVNQKGTWTIVGNQFNCATISGSAIATLETNNSDVTIYCDQYNANGVIARLSDSTHFWLTYRSTGQITIYENGSTQRAQVAHTWVNGDTLKVVCSGSTITASVGSDSCSYGSATSNQTATKHGIYAEGTSRTSDNFKVTVP